LVINIGSNFILKVFKQIWAFSTLKIEATITKTSATKCFEISKVLIQFIVDLQLVIRSKCCYEKNRWANVIVEAISLSTSFILLITLHFHCVFMRICWSLYWRCSPLFQCSASHTRSLPISLLVISLSLLFHHT